MENKHTDPQSSCPHFDRADWSLIEEPCACELCRFYDEADSLCRHREE